MEEPVRKILRARSRLSRVLKWFRSCAVCGSFRPPIDLLCESCGEDLERVRNRGGALLQPGYPFPVFSLFTWDEQTAPLVKPLLYAFKGGRSVEWGSRLAGSLLYERGLSGGQAPIFVHPPSSGGKPDHAWLLAHTLAMAWREPNAPVLALEKSDRGGKQKQRSVSERATRRFHARGKASFSDSVAPRVFVDDVITSGATAMAAYMALGDPARFEVWTLACRPKLAGAKGF